MNSPWVVEVVGFLLGEPGEFGRLERDLVGVEGEQRLGGAVLEGGDDLGHGVEHPQRHGPRHWGDGGGDDLHG